MQKKLIVTYTVLIAFVILLTGFISWRTNEKFYTNQLQQEFETRGKLFVHILQQGYRKEEPDFFNDFVSLYSKETNARITIIDEKGVVLADSDEDYQVMDNHKSRPEVKEALKGNVKSEVRYSRTMQNDYLYTAIPVNIESFQGVLRIAMPLEEIEDLNRTLLNYSIGGVFIGAIIAIIVGIIFAKKFTQPINELTEAALLISDGNYDKKIYVRTRDQIGKLAETFNIMTHQLKNTITELKQRNVQLESIMSSMINGVIAVDHQYRIMLINKVSYEILDLHEENVLFKPIYDVVRNKSIFEILEKSIENQEFIVGETKFEAKEMKILKVYANSITSKEAVDSNIGTLLVIQDITKMKKLELMRKDFVSNVTHELKTPLTSIQGFVDTLRNGAIQDPKVASRFLEIIDVEAERLYRLIQDILSLSEIENREKEKNLQYNSIKDIVEEVVEVLQREVDKKDIQILIEIPLELPKLFCNRDRIKQLIMNLLDNAIKYTEKGEIKVSCEKVQNQLSIIVQDTGIGVPKEDIPRLFERFYRVDKGRSRKMGGTGLGLSIVKHIVKLYEGKVFVDSQLGIGSKFTIYLPYEKTN